jgi:isoleucyl-tRNA synthetase
MFKPVDTQVDFPEQERELLKKWYSSGTVQKYLHRNDNSTKRFSFLDGPITANNPMGVHHGWGRTYKDLWQRFHNMLGYKQRFQNGFDCQGLWVEVEVEKELGVRNKKDIENLVEGDKKKSIAKFVELCKQRVLKFSTLQTEQTKRLGNFMDWENSYFTMSDENNYMIWHFLKKCYEKGWIYKGRDSVAWCPRCETAISQHEMLTEDYKELVHESIYFQLPIENRDKEYLLVWTTTPWTLPANIAVAVSEKLEYALVQTDSDDLCWIAKEAVERVFKKEYKKIVKTVKGKELVGLKYKYPFDDLTKSKKLKQEYPEKFHVVIATDDQIMPINSEEGTGLVHTAVSAGVEDFRLGKKYGLPMMDIIADNAEYLATMDFLSGKNAKKHPEVIFEYLKEREEKLDEKWIFNIERYKHRYPACWRCKTELVWKVTDEWYIAMDKKEKETGKTLRSQMMDTAKMIDWHPKFGLERELDWLKNMHDWLISKKNRYWGLALPIYECKKCGNFEVIGSKEELKERAVEGWEEFENHSPHKPFIDEVKIKCGDCGELVSRTDDVGNVWLDAGIVPFSTLIDPETKKLSYTTDKKYWEEWFPADFITESFPGQFKNWFYSLIAMSTVLEKKNSFNTLLGYGTVTGEDGRPMHKSWGNSIEFNEGADKIGVDVMRWMYATADPEQNLLFGYKKADETRRRFHLMLWNIYNFFVTYSNIDKWKPNPKAKASENVLDQWIVSRLDGAIKTVTVSLEQYNTQKATASIESFVNDFSLWHIRRSRNRVGPAVGNTDDKNAAYETIYFVLLNISKLLAPFTPFIADEIYTNLTSEESVHLADWPTYTKEPRTKNQELIDQMKHVRKIVELGLAARKEAMIKVKQPLSKITVLPGKKEVKIGKELDYLILDELNIKAVEYKSGSDDNETKVELDTRLTPELIAEKDAREIVRKIQEERKKIGTTMDEKIDVELEDWPNGLEDYIKKNALVNSISKGSFAVKQLK